MKSFAVMLCVLATLEAAWCHSSEEDTKAMKDCAADNKVKADDIKPFFDGKEVSKDVKCFMKCLLEAHHGIKEDGTLDVSIFKEHGHEDFFAMSAECASKIEKTDDLCELVYRHSVCMREKYTEGKVKDIMMEHIDEI